MPTLADLNVVIGADLDGFELALNRAEGSLNGFGNFAKTALAGAAAAVAASIVGLGSESLKAAGDIQALEKGFAATYKGALPLADALAKVKELSKLPGLGLKEALQGATNLQAAGFSADLATRALGAFGNALATVGKGKADLDGVGLALGQIASKGKISAEEIGQLAERVPQIRGAIAAAFGTSDSQALQKLNIDATTFVEGITAQLEKLPKVTGGINNAFENLGDASTVALAKLGTSLNNAFNIESLLGKAADLLNSFGDAATALEPILKDVNDALVRYFGQGGEGGRVFSDLADAAKSAGDAIADLGKSSGFGDLLVAAKPLQNLVREIGDGITAILDTFSGVTKGITSLVNGDFKGALAGGTQAIDGLTRPIRSLFGLIEQKSANFSEFFGLVPPPAKEAAAAIDQVVKALGGLSGDQLKALQALEKSLRDNRNASRALGDDYDFLGGKSKILESGVKSLTDAGFAPGGKVVQDYVKQLRAVPEALDQIALRTIKGTEKLFATPDFEFPKADLSIPEVNLEGFLPDYGEIFRDATQKVIIGGGELQTALGSASGAALQALLDFNTNTESLLQSFPAEAFSQIGQSIGQALGGGADVIEALGQGILKAASSFLAQFGQLVLLKGAADVAFGNVAQGLAELAAGTALIAGAALIGSASSGGGAGSSLASQPRASYNSNVSSNQQRLQVTVVGELKGRGQDLVAVLRGADYRSARTA